MKKICTFLSIALLVSSVAFAQTNPVKSTAKQANKEVVMEKRKAAMTEQLSKLSKDQLARQKTAIEKKITEETDERRVENMKLRLEVIDSLLK